MSGYITAVEPDKGLSTAFVGNTDDTVEWKGERVVVLIVMSPTADNEIHVQGLKAQGLGYMHSISFGREYTFRAVVATVRFTDYIEVKESVLSIRRSERDLLDDESDHPVFYITEMDKTLAAVEERVMAQCVTAVMSGLYSPGDVIDLFKPVESRPANFLTRLWRSIVNG